MSETGVHKVLVSACLLGQPVRYDGQSKGIVSDWLSALGAEGRVLAFCPEVAGGLPTPRPPAERQGERVVTASGLDVTAEFDRGAELALEICQTQGIRFALLKEGSPSCGSGRIYNGRFEGVSVAGEGKTTALLRRHGIAIFSEDQLAELASALFLDSSPDLAATGSGT
ncbi:hypothetical protein AMS64_22585 [Aeromonas veronii]|uniref:DUF523 domain-containing protein n=1 Tax=Aeromonas veronii TaxID=654 RepID=UPI00078EE4EE|nr:DUF523 domain-containing protein [Aeromonas veronii]AMQ44934.1 hypothetical protein AMS64_22585 [Aeromonas veronii]MCX0427176.1 DUF523 domain-containing protein [Aeromonas veronii]MCX0449397.1 DUF523 domain-containing protein [Aeromonas veronii]POG17818.1 DUF523 domain-containing protein [Aeromonas veronii]